MDETSSVCPPLTSVYNIMIFLQQGSGMDLMLPRRKIQYAGLRLQIPGYAEYQCS